MKEEFLEYLKIIGITTNTLIERIKSIYEMFEQIAPDEITDIFISEYINKKNEREYLDLDFYSKRYLFYAKNFIFKKKFGISYYQKQFRSFEIEMENYDFKNSTKDSRFTLTGYYKHSDRLIWIEKSTGENCDYLKKMIIKYIIPNLKL